MNRHLRAAIEVLRLTVARERLPEPPAPAVEPSPPRRSSLRSLFAREELSLDPELPPRARGGLFRLLFSPEPLPSDPPVEKARRSRWLAWLFAPERIDPS